MANRVEPGNCFVVGGVAGGIDGARHGKFSAKGAMNFGTRGVGDREGLSLHRECGGVDCAEEEVPSCALEGGGGFILRKVVDADSALFGIASNSGDNRKGPNGIDVVLDASTEGGEGGSTKEPCTIITVGGECQREGVRE